MKYSLVENGFPTMGYHNPIRQYKPPKINQSTIILNIPISLVAKTLKNLI